MQNKAGGGAVGEPCCQAAPATCDEHLDKEAPPGKAGGRGAPVKNCQIMNQDSWEKGTNKFKGRDLRQKTKPEL